MPLTANSQHQTTPQVIVLGSGTSNGVPMLGMTYPDGYLDNPKNHRTRPSIIVCGPTGNLLVDCTPELRLQATKEKITDIEAVLITHTHADHVMGMDDLRSITLRTKRDMPIYTLPRYQDDIRRIFPYAFADFPPDIEVPRFDMRDVPQVLDVGGLQFDIFQVWHGKIPVLALRVNDFAYVTDVSDIPPEARRKLNGLDTLILDAVRLKPHPNHFHLEKAIEVAFEIGARKTYFTHLSHDYDHDKTNSELPPGIELAHDRLRIPI
jgi:phosphoribosyl 1,2-cyclic phosphate phosphodiesterase